MIIKRSLEDRLKVRRKVGRPRKPGPKPIESLVLPEVYEGKTFWIRTDLLLGCVPKTSTSRREFSVLRQAFDLSGVLLELIPRSQAPKALCLVNEQLVFMV